MINFLKIVAKNRLAAFGGILLLIILTLSILAPILPLKEPNITNTADRFMVPFEGGHILELITYDEIYYLDFYGEHS